MKRQDFTQEQLADRYELAHKLAQKQTWRSSMEGKPVNEAYQFIGWSELPEDLDELDAKRRGRFLYVTRKNGDRERYTLEYAD